jgi:protein-tyrosine kinase
VKREIAPPIAPTYAKLGKSIGSGQFSGRRIKLDQRYLKSMRIIADDLAEPSSRGFEMLRTQIFRKVGDSGPQTIGITSPTPGCGKTVCAVNLALSMARLQERSITLVDLDLRKPQVATYMGLPKGSGVEDVLNGHNSLEEITLLPEAGQGQFRILPTFHSSRSAAALIASSQMADFVQHLRAQDPSGIVLFDLPPVLAVDDVISFLPHLDSILLVVASGQTTVSDISNSERLLGATEILGIVLNKAEEGFEVGYNY